MAGRESSDRVETGSQRPLQAVSGRLPIPWSVGGMEGIISSEAMGLVLCFGR